LSARPAQKRSDSTQKIQKSFLEFVMPVKTPISTRSSMKSKKENLTKVNRRLLIFKII